METLLLTLAVSLLACNAVEVPTVTLMNAAQPGTKMPVTGIGTASYGPPGEWWTDDVAEKAIGEWFKLGGRRVDESNTCINQVGVGKAITASGVPREDLFIVSKVGPREPLGYNDTLNRIQPILDSLQVKYLDLLLIHWPGPPGNSTDPACQGDPPTWRQCRQSTWRAMEEIFKSGKAKAIGVANFEKNHLEDIIAMNSTLPAINQVEFHPYWHEDDLVAFCKQHNITFNGYAPLGTPDWAPIVHTWNNSILAEPIIVQIAKSHNRSAAQIILRWEWQQGVLVNPRTIKTEHMTENLNFFDFELSEDEMKQISNDIKPPLINKVCGNPHNVK